MANKISNEYFTAVTECGETWRLVVNAKNGVEYANEKAILFAQNRCAKHKIVTDITLTSEHDGRVIVAPGQNTMMARHAQ